MGKQHYHDVLLRLFGYKFDIGALGIVLNTRGLTKEGSRIISKFRATT